MRAKQKGDANNLQRQTKQITQCCGRAQTASILRSCSLVASTLAACQTMNKVQHFKHWALCEMKDADGTVWGMRAGVYSHAVHRTVFWFPSHLNAFGARQWRVGTLSMARFLLRTICVRQLNLFARFHYITLAYFRENERWRTSRTWNVNENVHASQGGKMLFNYIAFTYRISSDVHSKLTRNSLETLTRRNILLHFGTFKRCPCQRCHTLTLR